MLGNLSTLDLRLIRVFLAVTDAGGVSAAQAVLNVGQSTISAQLSSLETRLGYRLCERGRSGFRLTPKGERFHAMSRKLLAALDEFGMAARHMDRQLVGTLNIGLIGHTPVSQNARIAEAIAAFRTRDEAVRFSISVRAPGDLEEKLLSNEIQIAVGYFWHRVPTLHYTPLFIERQIAYCGRGHPLFDGAGTLTPADVAGFEWAWRSYPLPEAQMSTTPDRVTATADNMEAVALLILSGHHLGYLPQHFAAPYVA
ncbi:LysR family transcriptional regulator, partial [Burkholderia sp. E168m23]